MSLFDPIWNQLLEDARGILYSPWIVGLATGKLQQQGWVEFIEQDSILLSSDRKLYEFLSSVYMKKIDSEKQSLLLSFCDHFKKQLDSRAQLIESIDLTDKKIIPKKAIKKYTELVNQACENENSNIILSILSIQTYLLSFIQQEYAKAIPELNSEYLHWIQMYTHETIDNACKSISELVTLLVNSSEQQSFSQNCQDILQLFFSFFNQFAYVPTLFTSSSIRCISFGHTWKRDWEKSEKLQSLLQQTSSSFEELLPSLIAYQKEEEEKPEEKEKYQYLADFCHSYCISIIPLEEQPSTHLSVGVGTFISLMNLLHFDIPILLHPSSQELSFLQSSQYHLQPLLSLLQYSSSSLPSKTLFICDSLMDIGLILIGPRFYQHQYLPQPPTMLTIAGSDSCGGAGIQADMKTATVLGVFSSSCITAVTSQNTQGVKLVELVSENSLRTQLKCVCEDITLGAVKIGMTGSRENVKIIAEAIKQYHLSNVVFDPVMAASSGQLLSKGDLCACFKENLIPLCDLITPNLPETKLLLGYAVEGTVEEMIKAAKQLVSLGCKNVLVKGGHMEGNEAVDVLYEGETGTVSLFKHPFVATTNSHGTGCTLSSAIASYLAKGYSMKEAVQAGGCFIENILEKSRNVYVGKGKQGIMNHMWMNYSF